MQPAPFNREKVLEALYTSADIDAAIGKMEPAHLREDLKQEMFVVLCDMPEARLQEMHEKGYLRWFLVRTMLNMAKSERSTFSRTFRRILIEFDRGGGSELFRKNRENPFEQETLFTEVPTCAADEKLAAEHQQAECVEPLIERVGPALESLHWYEAKMLTLYAEHGNNCRPIADKTGIPVRSVRIAVTAGKTKMKKLLRV